MLDVNQISSPYLASAAQCAPFFVTRLQGHVKPSPKCAKPGEEAVLGRASDLIVMDGLDIIKALINAIPTSQSRLVVDERDLTIVRAVGLSEVSRNMVAFQGLGVVNFQTSHFL